MKTNVLLALSLVSFVFICPAWADAPAQNWICTIQGELGVGGPAGTIWQTVTGEGSTESDALNAAMQNCMNQGLQMCSLTDCEQMSPQSSAQ